MIKMIKERADISLKIVLSIVFFCFLVFIGSKKEGFYVDEYFSFLLANTSVGEILAIQDRNTFTGQELLDMFYVQDEADRFDFGTAWENQANDNHPPLFYAMIHFVSSLTMHRFDMITVGLAINIILAMITFWVLMKLAGLFVENKMLAPVYALISCCTCYFIDTVTFVRMYMVLVLFTVLFIYILCKQIDQDDYRPAFYVQLYLVTFFGVFSQYFFLIMLVFGCLTFMVHLLSKKKWKELIWGVVSVCAALVTVYICFPACVDHLLFSQRGTEAFRNAGASDFTRRLSSMGAIVNNDIFGGIGVVVIVVLLVALILYVCGWKKQIANMQRLDYKYAILLIPAMLSFCVISKIAPGSTDRYIMETMPFISLGAFFMIRLLFSGISNKKLVDGGILALMAVCAVISFRDNALDYLYEHTEENKQVIEQYGTDTKCIYLYAEKAVYRTQCNLLELRDMTDITFYNHSDFLLYTTDFSQYDQLILFNTMVMTGEERDSIAQAAAEKGQYTSCKKISATGYASAYLLER